MTCVCMRLTAHNTRELPTNIGHHDAENETRCQDAEGDGAETLLRDVVADQVLRDLRVLGGVDTFAFVNIMEYIEILGIIMFKFL